MDYLLDDLVDYTMEKNASEQRDRYEEDLYDQELIKAKKRKQIGLGLLGGGSASNQAVQLHGGKEFNKLQERRDQEAADRLKANGSKLFFLDFKDTTNRLNDQQEHSRKMVRRTALPAAAFWAGAGTLGYNSVKKKQARRRYESYLRNRKDEEE